MSKSEQILLEGEDNPTKTVWTDDALIAMDKHSILFGKYIAENTIPAGDNKFYHKEYLTKGKKKKKAYNIKELYNRFNNEK